MSQLYVFVRLHISCNLFAQRRFFKVALANGMFGFYPLYGVYKENMKGEMIIHTDFKLY